VEPEGDTQTRFRELLRKLEEMLGNCVLVVGVSTLRALGAVNPQLKYRVGHKDLPLFEEV